MKICFVLTAVALIASAGCAARQSPGMQDFQDYVAQNKDRVERGELKRSEYYNTLYSKASAGNAPSHTLVILNELIRASEQYEAGAITKEDYEYRKRVATIQDRAAQQDINRAADAQRDASSAALVASGLAMMQASQSRVLGAPPPDVVAAPRLMSLPGYLKAQSVNGALRYCTYTNGIVTTTAATTLCPNSAQ